MDEGRDLADFAGDDVAAAGPSESEVADEPIDDILPMWSVVKYGAKPGGIVPSGSRRRAQLLLTIAQLRYEVGLLDEYGAVPPADHRVKHQRGRYGMYL
jgi:hypothetical protein